MAGKKIKLLEEAISEIVVADTNSESGAEARPPIVWKTKFGCKKCFVTRESP
jgi:hypothetical protein